ncbi:aerobic carbon-monoxide dehydrogenase large subunit [Haliangium ochraceum]|uniref:Carbon-monoxide dehydrogenase, large subunit n=1 Tax=Haliangium ochraceum (strain DSM 14365 / JCM 11303 / SMP-2) TaxID=502025 RepID=D0LFU3_HALO1|nr:aerobic carbon-monoxide dehydrogenase large subunit [Haliangium ochraceum]ACY14545.1 carbon-monoxide dehydrogenase, large subunit [Haliangium ochraceum DSM 14365]
MATPKQAPKKKLCGIGHPLKRKEDGRFLRGRGNYVDDVQLPRMLHMVILRSPMAHARIVDIDTSAALELPGVVAVLTGKDLEAHNLAWMPTLSGDTQAVLATDKVRFQGQEVAAVIATSAYIAADALELIDVEYEELTPVVDPKFALTPEAPLIRDEKEGQTDNRSYHWETGEREKVDALFAQADHVVKLDTLYPRCHPAPLETCGCVADVNGATGKATIYLTSQAPHAHRTLFSMVSGLPEQQVRIISPDIGGGFGNKVPIYPGYVVATAASLVLDRPVKWIETRSENLISTGFARDYHMSGELALKADGTMLALRVSLISDHGAFYADAQPTKFKAGLFHIVTGSYDIQAAHIVADGAFTNKAPGGVAYRCSFRVTEASYLIERLVQNASLVLGMDPSELRRKNFIPPERFPYESCTGFVYDSGEYERALDLALDKVGYADLRREQAEARAQGRLIGIGLASFTEVVGAGPSRIYDIAGLGMFDSAELRVHPTGKAILKLGVKSQGQGHETTFAQIVASELGIPADDIAVQEGDTDNTPFGLGTYASRSTPTAGAATAVIARKLREKAKKIAAHLLETSEDDLEWSEDHFAVKGTDRSVTIQEIAMAAYSNIGEGIEAGLEGVHYYDPPNMTYPFGSYIVVVEVDADTGQWKVLRMVAVDDCGVRINPMIVEGQIHGGLTEGFAIAAMQEISFDEFGNCLGSNFMDYLIPTAWDTPRFETYATETPSPHHPIGAKGVGESATVGSPAAYVNAVVDALQHLGVTNIEMPLSPAKVWSAIQAARGSQPPA